LYLGHDGPETEIESSFLFSLAPHLYCHAKNVHALDFLLKHKEKLKSFSHDVDDHVITSDGRIWTFPGKELVKGAIAVMPERANVQQNIWECYAICTDYADLYYTYMEMRQRNIRNILNASSSSSSSSLSKPSLFIDEMILGNRIDPRRCIPVYTYYDHFTPSPELMELHRRLEIEFSKQTIYRVNGPLAYLHWTIMQVLGFEQYEEFSSIFNSRQSDYLSILTSEMKSLLPLKISFRGLIPVPSGIVMMGFPDKDVNGIRRKCEKALEEAGLPFRKYQNDIIHSTILRLCHSDVNPEHLVNFAHTWVMFILDHSLLLNFALGMLVGECNQIMNAL